MNIKAIIFDFDGVLVESVDVKTKAFAALYSEYGKDIVDKVIAYHLANGGISRFEKFRYYHQKFLNIPLSESKEQALGKEFSDLVEETIVGLPQTEDVQEFLELYSKQLPLFVVSGTPDVELKRIIKRRGMAKFFVSVHGSPEKKGILIENILNRHNLDRENVLMVGDAMTDYDGAIAAGVHFAGIVKKETKSCFPKGVLVLSTLTELHKLITQQSTCQLS